MIGGSTGFWICVTIAAFALFVFASAGDSAGSSSYDFRDEPMFCYAGPSGDGDC